MAKLVMHQKEFEIKDGASLGPTCESAGLAFNCHTGVCGSCLIDILHGENNLSALTQEEHALGLSPQRRLACQCRILHGTVTIGF